MAAVTAIDAEVALFSTGIVGIFVAYYLEHLGVKNVVLIDPRGQVRFLLDKRGWGYSDI